MTVCWGGIIVLFPIVFTAMVIGFIPACIASRKGKNFWTWYLYGVCLFFFAMIHAIILPEKNQNDISSVNTLYPVNTTLIKPSTNIITKFDIDCPVEIRDYEILVNEQKFTYCTIDFFNLSNKTVQAMDFTIFCYDSFGRPVSDDNTVQTLVQDECASPKLHFGKNKTIPLLNHLSTRKVDVIINKILFLDGTTWNKENKQLWENKIEGIPDSQELERLRSIAGYDAYCYPKELEDVWICICGKVNKSTDHSCRRCERQKDFVLTNYDKESIIKESSQNHEIQEMKLEKFREMMEMDKRKQFDAYEKQIDELKRKIQELEEE